MKILPALLFVALVTPSQQMKATLRQGEISGTEETDEKGNIYHAFRNIPYAQPPTGDLRFKDPVPAKGWEGVRDGSLTPPLCPQVDLPLYHAGKKVIRGQEDCLYLNVFTPEGPHTKLPVMVWIHEGAFLVGGVSQLSPRPLVSRGVVLVTLHYRLGTLGFISTGDSVLPGNLGLKDQTLALRWVKDNIHDLGGDPEKVTIFGVSSGASSAHFQVLTPYAKGLFHRAILQSGTGLCSWSSRTDHREVAVKVGQLLNCSEAGSTAEDLDSRALLACLQKAPLEELVSVPQAFTIWSNEPIVMVPRVDGDFIPDFPATLLKNNRYNKVDLIAGVTAHEGAFVTKFVYARKALRESLVTNFTTVGPLVMNFRGGDEEPLYLARRVFFHYLGDIEVTEENADSVTELFSDRLFKTCIEDTLKAHLDTADPTSKAFFYTLTHRGQKGFLDMLKLPVGKRWVSHTDDKQYLWDDSLQHPADQMVQHLMTRMWTAFANTGNPTPDSSLGFKWQPVSRSSLAFLEIQPAADMAPDGRERVRAFWADLPTRQNKILYPERFLSPSRPSC
ncbi:venom carboxylesterase-6-like isoform X1 [Penaeus monodon]|uniref:venom carboxylesterase-6-like isoform X1 n=1 Tax=Penaeus monodon TaxID=6687 RepID=UPI0018A70368|nr:venom carboxylesterase-6-like isoform X1 [Penaeus monodon]